jgi:integrase/recombinase XerD
MKKSTELTVRNEKDLENALSLYRTFMANFLSNDTKVAYENDYRDFSKFFLEKFGPLSFRKVTQDHVIQFRDKLRDERYSPVSINRKLSALSSFFGRLHEEQLISRNPVQGVRRPPSKSKRPRLGFTNEEVRLIAEHHESESVQGLNNKSILLFLFYTGVRISELVGVRVSDLDVRGGIPVVHIKGKGEKLRTLALHHKLQLILKELIERRSKGEDDFLFTRVQVESKEPLRRESVALLLKKTLSELELERDRSPHSARRTLISNLLERGAKLQSVAELAGHSNLNTTKAYNVRKEKIEDSPLLTTEY